MWMCCRDIRPPHLIFLMGDLAELGLQREMRVLCLFIFVSR